MYTCHFCAEIFQDHAKLYKHELDKHLSHFYNEPERQKLDEQNTTKGDCKEPISIKIPKEKIGKPLEPYCFECDLDFDSEIDFQDHNTEVHQGHEANIACKICSKVCTNKRSLWAHGFRKHSNCLTCDLDFDSKDKCQEHMDEFHPDQLFLNLRRFSCKRCDSTFVNESDAKNHAKLEVDSILKCGKCDMKFCTSMALTRHIGKVHGKSTLNSSIRVQKAEKRKIEKPLEPPPKIPRTSRNRTCSSCDHEFSDRAKLKIHKKAPKNEVIRCDYCNFKSCTKIGYGMHLSNIHCFSKTCAKCGEEFRNVQKCMDHLKENFDCRTFVYNKLDISEVTHIIEEDPEIFEIQKQTFEEVETKERDFSERQEKGLEEDSDIEDKDEELPLAKKHSVPVYNVLPKPKKGQWIVLLKKFENKA